MSEKPLTVAELERLLAHATAHAATLDWPGVLAAVCRHALALEAEVARLRQQESARRAMRHEVHEDDGETT